MVGNDNYRLRIDLGDGELHTAAVAVHRRCSAAHGHHPDRFDDEADGERDGERDGN